ncbi:hypothetical protein [Agromyces aerolatus]|uniref:hypothetical protein n=1 Tax=Agromyces sp. LY-1074 TaxID=3074080 RepID=UPI0028660BD5|nr:MULTISPECIES: hypothetical protein [unclassified Agromyces]MDR5701881.1 hypothetical protein [Agromyces sp. LY-1074]MDR5708105.1 hypothetical protein [Agromyces sp. LY-1358]
MAYFSSRLRTRAASVLAVAAAGALLLSACGRADAPEAAAAAIDEAPATGVVDIWAPSGDANYLDTLLDGFRADNPEATVNVTIIPTNEYLRRSKPPSPRIRCLMSRW